MDIESAIEPVDEKEFGTVYEIINDAAAAYKGNIPEYLWHEPYMSKEELADEIRDGVRFFSYREHGAIIGVMGIQNKEDVNLIRHAYVRSIRRNKGVGGALLGYLTGKSNKPVLVGTWKAATWAIQFYEKHGFVLVEEDVKNFLLRKYWNVPGRQIEASVVLADRPFMAELDSV